MTWISANRFLTQAEKENNAGIFYDYFSTRGWSDNAICAMLGNIESESTINSGIWQSLDEGNTAGGYGLVQWTPAEKFLTWARDNNYYNPDSNIAQFERIIYEKNNFLQWIVKDEYPLTFQQFAISNESIPYLTRCFLLNYEKPANLVQPQRETQAQNWYNFLIGNSVASYYPPHMKLIYYLKPF